jgi:hypothetical protein
MQNLQKAPYRSHWISDLMAKTGCHLSNQVQPLQTGHFFFICSASVTSLAISTIPNKLPSYQRPERLY